MRVPELYKTNHPTISIELFPPKTEKAESQLFHEVIPKLKQLRPAFMSVTYGAGGGTRDNTLRITHRLNKEFGIESMAHLTCSGSTKEMIASYLDEAQSLGIENILALRGDPPKGEDTYQTVEGGFRYAIDLIKMVKTWDCFAIGAAAYPEGHSECPDKYLDWDRAVLKVEAGAEYLITQLFYQVEDFYEFSDYLQNKKGLKVPIVPGILPFLSTAQIKRFTNLCGAKLPDPILKKLEAYADDDESVRRLGVEVCTDLCKRLLEFGVPGIHLYCLNRYASVSEIMNNLGLAKNVA